jgi:hypothetical protein
MAERILNGVYECDCTGGCDHPAMHFNNVPVVDNDPVNHPSHYTAYKGLEIIDLTEQMNFNRGNAVKYIARAGLKNPTAAAEIEDLEKASWYIRREIERLRQGQR